MRSCYDVFMTEAHQYSLRIDGMHCGSCVRRVTQTLAAIEGVQVEEVRIGAARIASAGKDAVESTIAALGKIGFTAHLEQ